MYKPKKPYPGTQAVLRAIHILKHFSDEQPEWGVAELAEALDLNRTTAYRLLSALESEGLVFRNEQSESFRLGSELIVLGSRALRANPLRTLAHPELIELTTASGESSWLDVLDGSHTLTLDEVRGRYLLGMASSVGARWPAHACSTGKVLLAFADPTLVENLFKQTLDKLTPQTLTEPDALRKELSCVRAQGYGIEFDELEVGHSSVSTPIFNHRGEGIAAISISGPSARLSKKKLVRLSELLKSASTRISFQLGYREGAV